MKAAVLTGIRRMEIQDVREPRLRGERDVRIRVRSVGVCGSDVHYYLTGRIGSQVVEYPYRVGHEFAGEVEDVAAAVTRVRAGDLVAVDPAMPCGRCDQCLAGRSHTCRRLRFLGCPGQADGCLCEYIVMPEECCYPVRPSVGADAAALIEPLSIGLYSVRQSPVASGSRIGILGCGPIGLSVLWAAKAAGARAVYATDPIDARLAAARAAGAGWTANPDREDIVAAVAEREPLLLDAVFECCGRQEALDQAAELLRPGGTLMLIGIPEEDRVSFLLDTLRRRELCIRNVRRQNECVAPAIEYVESGQWNVNSLITHRFALDHAREAFEMLAGYRDGVVKAMIRMDSRAEAC